MDTYRYHSHSMSDLGSTYRTRDEISGVRQEYDPIERVRKLMYAHDLPTHAELKDMEKEIRKQVDYAIAKAKESSMPDASELFTNVYKKGGVEEPHQMERARKLIYAHDLASASELEDIEREIRKQVHGAIAKVKESSMPDTSELFTNVYKKGFGVDHDMASIGKAFAREDMAGLYEKLLRGDISEEEVIKFELFLRSLTRKIPLGEIPQSLCDYLMREDTLDSLCSAEGFLHRERSKSAVTYVKQRNSPRKIVIKTLGLVEQKPPGESGLVEKRCRALMSRRHDIEFLENSSFRFYNGPIFNTVTWPLDGSNEEVINAHLYATGHHRLWHFSNGMLLDVSDLFGPRKVLYTTAQKGTFYLKFSYREHQVTLPIDGRLGWNFGVQNKHSTFEFDHNETLMYLDVFEKWKLLLGFSGDYGVNGLCPNGLGNIPMGIEAARHACEVLSEYKGELPVPEVVRECCATLIAYGPEALKFNVVLDKTVLSLGEKYVCITLDNLSPVLAPVMKRWSNFGGAGLHTCLWMLESPTTVTEAKLREVPGIVTTVDRALDAVNVMPYNKIPFPGSRNREWKAFGLDPGSHLAEGRPHALSPDFARRWPYNEQLAVNRPYDRFISTGKNLKFAKSIKATEAVVRALAAMKRMPK